MDEENKIMSTWQSQRTIHKGHVNQFRKGEEYEQKRWYSRQRPECGDGEDCGSLRLGNKGETITR